jgi:hypothetical protein
LTAFSSGLVVGGLVSGTVVGALGGLVSVVPLTGRIWVLAAVIAVIMVFELAGRPLQLLQNRRLVPQEIIPRSRFEGPFQFGFEMGTGVRTFTPTALPHALVITVLLVGGILPGVLAGLGFGLGRILMPLTRSRSGDPEGWDRNLLRWVVWVGRICAAGFLLALLVALITGGPWS